MVFFLSVQNKMVHDKTKYLFGFFTDSLRKYVGCITPSMDLNNPILFCWQSITNLMSCIMVKRQIYYVIRGLIFQKEMRIQIIKFLHFEFVKHADWNIGRCFVCGKRKEPGIIGETCRQWKTGILDNITTPPPPPLGNLQCKYMYWLWKIK